MQRILDVAGWLSLFAGFIVAVVSFYSLAGLSPWATHAPWYQLDVLIRHFTYAGPFFLAGWLAFIPSRQKRALLLPTLGWTGLFVLPRVVVLGMEWMARSRDHGKPDLEHAAPAD